MAARKPLVLNVAQQQQIQSGDTLQLQAAVAGGASLNIPHGTAPTSPVDGDVWTTSAGIFVRVNGTTVGPLVASGGGGSSGLTLISSTTLAVAASSVTFSSIASTYKDLVIVGQARSSIAAASDIVRLQFNADTAANYEALRWNQFGTSSTAAVAYIELTGLVGSTGLTNVGNTFSVQIVNYAGTTFHKEAITMAAVTAGPPFASIGTGRWKSTAAISQVKLLSPADTFVAGSVFSLYGRN